MMKPSLQIQKVLATQPDYSSAHLGLWGAFYKKGMENKAVQEAEQFFGALGDQEVVRALQEGYREAGYRRAMKRAADTLAARSERTHVPSVRIARLYAHAGRDERTLFWLEGHAAVREPLDPSRRGTGLGRSTFPTCEFKTSCTAWGCRSKAPYFLLCSPWHVPHNAVKSR